VCLPRKVPLLGAASKLNLELAPWPPVRASRQSDRRNFRVRRMAGCSSRAKWPASNVRFGTGHVSLVCLGFFDLERRVETTPQGEGWWRVAAKPLPPRGIGRDVDPVVIEHVHLDVALARTAQKRELVGPEVWVVEDMFGLIPTCRWRVASKDKRFARRAVSFLERSAQKSRRVCRSGPKPFS